MTDDVADVDDLLDNCCQGFGVPEEDVYMVHLVPVKEGEPLSEDMACVVKSESFSIDYIEAILERNRRLEEKVARSAEALEVLASQVPLCCESHRCESAKTTLTGSRLRGVRRQFCN